MILKVFLFFTLIISSQASRREQSLPTKDAIGEETLFHNDGATSAQFGTAAISCDAPGCSEIGIEIFQDGGSVVDAAISTLLCMGVINSQSSGVGGGFFATLYNRTTGESITLNAREMAGSLATEDMFEGDPSLSQRGPLAIAVPGEIKGYWELYQKGGKLPWARLLQPTIDLCRNGYLVSTSAAGNMQSHRAAILREPSMKELYVNPETGDVWNAGDIMKNPALAQTLETIANSPLGGDELYVGVLARVLAEDLAALGSIITLNDIQNYRIEWADSLRSNIAGNFTVHTTPPPSSGVLLGFMLNVLNDYLPEGENGFDNAVNYQRIIETFKHTYAKRTILGDPADANVTDIVNELVANLTSIDYALNIRAMIDDTATNNTYEFYGAEYYQPDNKGTAHVSVIGPTGDAIAITSTINLSFGAQVRSVRTGILFNDEMDDFSAPNITNYFGVPPSPNNFIRPGKRPLSSMTPTIFTDSEGRVRLVIGAAGGTKITTTTTMVAIRNLWFKQSVQDSIAARRFHHQLYPMEIQYEDGVSEDIIQKLMEMGHEVDKFNVGMAVSCGVARAENGTIFASSDFRKMGSVAGY